MRKINLVLLLSMIMSCNLFAQQQEDLDSLVNKASETFHLANSNTQQGIDSKKLYLQAAQTYEHVILQGGFDNSKLYYNIGNSYMLAGEIGKAILNYRRALDLNDFDPQIQKNLDYARSQRIDKIKPAVETQIIKQIVFWHYDISLRTRFIAAFSLLLLLIWLVTLRIWIGRFPAVYLLIFSAAVAFSMFAGSVGYECYEKAGVINGVIISDSVSAKQGDGENYPDAFNAALHEGTDFRLVEGRGDWYRIELDNGYSAWIQAKAAEII